MTKMTKDQFHTRYAAALRKIAKDMGLPSGSFSVRSNKAGPAILGEVVLHTEKFYLMVGGSCCEADRPDVMYRACKGLKDYTGGVNRWDLTAEMILGDRPETIRRLQSAQERARL